MFEDMDDAPVEQTEVNPTPAVETPVKRGRGRPKGSKGIKKVITCPKCGTVIE
jgi:hypothetical protein